MPKITDFEKGEFTEWVGFLGDVAVVADASGYLRFGLKNENLVQIHDGLLCAARSLDGKSLITGGEDGNICQTDSSGRTLIVYEAGKRWIDKIATGPEGCVAFGSGRKGKIIYSSGKTRDLEVERTIEGLAFAPKGMRLAIARYDGVDLQWINSQAAPKFLEWKGAHTGVMFSPNGKYVVSTMQENALHGWRLGDDKHMKMSGYPAKVGSSSWSHNGKWLATSGAPAAIVWPFSGKDGPMGKAPKELGSMGKLMVTQVCCHPGADMLAIGYENGMIMAASIIDEKIVSLRAKGQGAISSMGWDASGGILVFGSEEGEAGVIELS